MRVKVLQVCFWKPKKLRRERERERGRERVSERGHAVTLRREMITESDLYVHVGVNFKNLHFWDLHFTLFFFFSLYFIFIIFSS